MRDDIKDTIAFLAKEDISLFNKAELARRYDCDPRTIDRYLKIQSGELIPKQSSRVYYSKLDDYKATIINKVDIYGCTAMAVYKFIRKRGYSGKYSIVADFVKHHKDTETKKATIRFETNPGLQAQVDWKEDMTLVNRIGQAYKVNIFLMVMGFSRKKFIMITSDRSQETLFQCMIEAFKFYGGLPHEILFDNMKTVVNHAKSSFAQTVFNDRFEPFAKDMGFIPVACRPYRPQTKGKAEALAKLMNRLKAYNEEFDTWDDLIAISNEFLADINQEISQGCDDIPDELFKKEKEYLLPLPHMELLNSYISRQEEKTYPVNRESMIKYEGRKYSVPTRYIGERMTVTKEDNDTLSIYYNKQLVVCHAVTNRKYNYTVDTACDILRSDAMKGRSDAEILDFVKNNLLNMDRCIGGL
jgi:transposase